MLRRWRPRSSGQVVTGSVVFGDVVQIADVGGDVTVSPSPRPYRVTPATVGAAELTPDRARAQPSRLLLARYQVVPFTGRTRTLDDLDTWISGPDPVAARLIHAAGGQGKTRLAAEVANQCAAAGWTVWTVTHHATPVPGSRVDLPGGALLAVVDYADRWPVSALQALLTQLGQLHARAGTTVRVLLLSRSSGHWWQAVARQAESDGAETSSTALPALAADSDDDRLALFTTAAAHFGRALHPSYPGPWPAPDLTGSGFAQVLAVHMAALAAVDAHRHGSEPPTHPHAVSAYLLGREQAHWQELHARRESPPTTAPTVMQRTTYVAVLTGPLPRPDARQALVQLALAGNPSAADQLIDDHRICYPPADHRTVLEPLLPDRLAEDFLALSTPGHHLDDDLGLLTDDWTLTAPGALLEGGDATGRVDSMISTLTEAAHRWPHLAEEVLYPLVRRHPELITSTGGATLARLVSIPTIDVSVLEALEPHLPLDRHIDFDLAAASISSHLTRHRLAHTDDPSARAALHAEHSWRLDNAGRHDEALAAAEQAAAGYRRLAEENPARHAADLGGSLVNLSNQMARLGRPAEALTAAEDGVAIFRGLASAEAGTRLPDLAAALDVLGNRLTEVGLPEKALAATEEAVSVYRRLADDDPGTYLSDLAMSMNNLGNRLSRLGRAAEAVSPAETATALARELATIHPATHLPHLALCLTNLGSTLFALGDRERAVSLSREAAEIYRRLADDNPGVYHEPLALSLNNLGAHLAAQGRSDEAVVAAEEALAIRRRLAEVRPGAHLPGLAASLANLGLFLSRLGDRERAITMLEESTVIRRRLADSHPAVHRQALAVSLSNLSVQYLEADHVEESLAAAREAAAIHRDLVTANPVPHLPDLAHSLCNLSNAQVRIGLRRSALATAREATAISRRLAADHPGAHSPLLTTALHVLGQRLGDQGDWAGAIAVTDEATGIIRGLARRNPEAHLADLAKSLMTYAGLCATAQANLRQALSCVIESLRIYQPLAARNPDEFEALWFRAGLVFADVLAKLGEEEKAAIVRARLKRIAGLPENG
ncbi:tetratricopeptide repeat protein [Actinoplanes flavus]|uniref:Tetratricopeptide repeat protein n=1 Tax=Actinoplanes flavus TaxID=2820290 RepID=A0ABS3UKL2_9ACTN|nr:tetratricopeptide repeat protein [Actinoplanes flavus]MBO3739327.1 tetratricopeptide repeat protein [Actinoplanes flavus]